MYKETVTMEEMNVLKTHEESDPILEPNKKSSEIVKKLKGILSAFGWTLMVALSATCVPLLRREIPDFELNVFRATPALLIELCFCVYKKNFPKIPKSEIPIVIVFSLSAACTPFPMYIAVTFVPVATVQAIMLTSVLISGLFIFYLMLGEKITFFRILAAVILVFGVFLTIQPEFVFPQTNKVSNTGVNSTEKNNGSTLGTTSYKNNRGYAYLGYSLSVMAGLFLATNTMLLKKFEVLGENRNSLCICLFGTGTFLSLIVMAIFENPVLPKNWLQVLAITGHTIGFVVQWPLYIYSSQCISGNTFSVITSALVVFMLVSQYTVLSHILPGHRNWMEVVGVVLVFFGSSLGSCIELYKE